MHSCYICYESIRIIWVPAVDNGCHFGHHFRSRVRNFLKAQVAVDKLITR
jgi:hypothetical protein